MTRFVVKTALYVLCVVLSTVLLCVAMLSVPNEDCRNSHEMNVSRSIERLKVAKGPKVIFIGGSGLAFGLKSERVEKAVGMPVYNTGTHAGLGLRLQLALVKPYVGDGDVVVCVPEYQQYLGGFMYGNETALRILSSSYPQGYRYVSLRQYVYLLRYVPDAFFSAISARNAVPYGGPYSVSALNKYGDVECYEHRGHVEGIQELQLDGPLQPRSVSLLKDFGAFCVEQGASVLLLPPAYRETAFHTNETRIDEIWGRVNDSGLPMISSPEKYCFPDSCFFDTDYHLTEQGVDRRTERMISDIQAFMSSNRYICYSIP